MRKRLATWALALAGLMALGVGVTALVLEVQAASAVFPRSWLRPLPGSIRVLDAGGSLLREAPSRRGERVRWVPLERVAPVFLAAILAAEDARFLQHRGLDYRALLRAALSQIGGGRQGGSTITQQLVKQLRPRPRTLAAKWREAVLARRLEGILGKAEILEQYLNRVPFGPGVRGVEAAAWWLYRKHATRLSLPEAALLAGLPRAPTAYHPRRHPSRARARRRWVLGRMKRLGLLDARQEVEAARAPLGLAPAGRIFGAPHFVRRVLSGLPPEARVVRTTLSSDLQRRVEAAVRAQAPWLRRHGATQAAVVVLDNDSAGVLAYVGSVGWADSAGGRNDGLRARRQPGSVLKPLVYALAFERGFTPGSLLRDLPLEIPTPTGVYRPRNFDRRFHGPVVAAEALVYSHNVAAVWLTEKVGLAAVLERFRAAGLESLHRSARYYGPGLVLGNGEVTPLEVAAAYLTLARGGLRARPRPLLADPAPTPRRIYTRLAAYQVTAVLADPHLRREAHGVGSALEVPFPVAVKTGTSTDHRDTWAAGYTPEVTVAAWVGNFSGAPTRGLTGATGAARVWRAALLEAMRGRPHQGFEQPAGLTWVSVCGISGSRPTKRCGSRRSLPFLSGTQPTDACDVH